MDVIAQGDIRVLAKALKDLIEVVRSLTIKQAVQEEEIRLIKKTIEGIPAGEDIEAGAATIFRDGKVYNAESNNL
jgi:hypothetical protein